MNDICFLNKPVSELSELTNSLQNKYKIYNLNLIHFFTFCVLFDKAAHHIFEWLHCIIYYSQCIAVQIEMLD